MPCTASLSHGFSVLLLYVAVHVILGSMILFRLTLVNLRRFIIRVPWRSQILWHLYLMLLVQSFFCKTICNYTLSLMESNLVAELLRVIRRLSMKEQWTDTSLLYLSLRILHSTLSQNPRGQTHFKSIGGLEVLLDGLGIPSNNGLLLKSSASAADKR